VPLLSFNHNERIRLDIGRNLQLCWGRMVARRHLSEGVAHGAGIKGRILGLAAKTGFRPARLLHRQQSWGDQAQHQTD
jgi:hypothetical protein